MREKNIIDFLKVFCLSYCFLFVEFFIVLLCPFFYDFLFWVFGIYSGEFSREFVLGAVDNLISFYLHSSSLSLEFWNSKEIAHFLDIREIFDFFIFVFICCISFLGLFRFDLNDFKKSVKINLIFVCLPLLTFPVFSWFWNVLFHPLFFSNDLWMLFPEDLCYWIFPLEFFIGFYLIFVFLEVLILGGCWFDFKKISLK